MKKKDKKKEKSTRVSKSKVPSIGLETLTFRGLKRMAISMGMPFPDACSGDVNSLGTYIQKNLHIQPNENLIAEYDNWMDEQLALAGFEKDDPMRHYQLRLSYISEDAMEKAPKLGTKPKKEKTEKKAKREKDESGLWKGTKKSYTFELAKRGYSLERVTRRVTTKFPDANLSSIKQWYKKYHKQLDSN